MKLKKTKYKGIRYDAHCMACDWSSNSSHLDRPKVSRGAANHVKDTGHSVSIIDGSESIYEVDNG